MDVQSLFRRAVGLHQGGKLGEAARLYKDILAQEPKNSTARQLLALIYLGEGRVQEALAEIDQVLAATPDAPEALATRGNILIKLDRLGDALTSFDRAIAMKPDYAEAFYNRGNCRQYLGRHEEAVADYTRTLALQPDYEPALTNRGNARKALGRFEQALADYESAEKLRPGDAIALYHRAGALQDLRRFDEALAIYDVALAMDRGLTQAWNDRGNVLRALQRFDEALGSFDRALGLDSEFTAAWNNRGSVLRDLGRPEEALSSFDRSLDLAPGNKDALFNRATLNWSEYGRYREALDDLTKVVQIDPDYEYARGNLFHLKMYGGDWRGFAQEKALIDRGVRESKKIVEPFVYQAISDSPADLLACAKTQALLYPPGPPAWRKAPRARRKLRVGYLSGEFRVQATQYLAAGLYEAHDRAAFEIVAFDNGESDQSAMRARLEAAFDQFIPISRLTDREAAECIRDQEIDILVNLNGYFGRHRMGVFALKPAPIQVNFLGFPGTLGAPYMDYILADRIVIPKDECQFYAEQVVWLPDCYQVNDTKRAIAAHRPARTEQGLPEKAFVFCNFNQGYKLTPQIFAIWMRLLKDTEGSVLWLMASSDEFFHHLRQEAERLGVAGDRLVFAKASPLDRHLARASLADLVLDTLPYNAHTTASDALWAGVPLLTCRGRTFAGRVAASLLTAIGMPELIAEDLSAYEALALKLAREPQALGACREKLAQNRMTYPLFDTDRFRRHIEAAYRRMWEIAERGEASRSFHIEA